jgi:proteic killer suppression protein
MIASFKHRGLKRFYEKGETKHIAPDHLKKVSAILTVLDSAVIIDDMKLATFKLYRLTGNRQDAWSVTVHANWRITFIFENGEAHVVNYEDYHGR